MSDPTDDLTDDERAQYEREWEQLDEKVILAQILAELQQIRMALSDADTDASRDEWRCTKCGTTVDADDRARHAQGQHNAPPGLAAELFEKVER